MMSACTHQFTVAASVPSARRNSSRKVTISVAMKQPMSTDSPDSGPSASGRSTTRRTSRKRIPPSTPTANGTSASA